MMKRLRKLFSNARTLLQKHTQPIIVGVLIGFIAGVVLSPVQWGITEFLEGCPRESVYEGQLHEAYELLASGRNATALEIFDRLFQEIPKEKCPELYANLRANQGVAYLKLGQQQNRRKNLEVAVRTIEDALTHYREADDEIWTARLTENLGLCYALLADIIDTEENARRAVTFFEDAMRRYKRLEAKHDYGEATLSLGSTYFMLAERGIDKSANLTKALEAHTETVEVFSELGDRASASKALLGLVGDYAELGRVNSDTVALGKAQESLGRAENLVEDSGGRRQVIAMQVAKGNVALAQARIDEERRAYFVRQGEQAFQQALVVIDSVYDPWTWARTTANLALSYSDLGRLTGDTRFLETSAQYLRSSVSVLETQEVPLELASIERQLGDVYVELAKNTGEDEYLSKALTSYRRVLALHQVVGEETTELQRKIRELQSQPN